MGETVLMLFREYPEAAIFISIAANVLIALSGVLPSYFLTAANIYFFGIYGGTALSILGESLGAWIAFLLYRKGFKGFTRDKLKRYKRVEPLINLKGSRAFQFILILRLMPFMPSGVVTFFSAVGVVSVTTFVLASTIGKIPALLIEALAVHQVLEWNMTGKLILMAISLFFLWNLFIVMKNKNRT